MKDSRRDPAQAMPPPAPAPVAGGTTSEALLGGAGELKITHNGEQYTLRRTRNGKLILTK